MFTIKPAKLLQGKFTLPPSPDLFFLTAIIAIASKQVVKIFPFVNTPLCQKYLDMIKGLADFEAEQNVCTIIPKSADESAEFIPIEYNILPYREIIVFTLLGLGKTLAFDLISTKKIDYWKKLALKFDFKIESEQFDNRIGLSIKSFPENIRENLIITETDISPLLGLLLGSHQDFSFNTDFVFSNPLRLILPHFDFELSVKSLMRKENDPLARRIQMIQSKKKQSSSGQKFLVTVNFSKKEISEKPLELTLPGDEILGALLTTAKCLLPKGAFVLDNMPLETWATPVLTFIKKMGCKVSVQETHRCSFGSVGMVNVQKFELTGRKMECSPAENYFPYIPSLVILAAFAKGQSVFRNMEELRNDEPDGIDLVEYCIRKLGARHGEMPDGIVLEGGVDFDGFDFTENYPAFISGSFAAAGLKCMGETHIEDENIKQRWPNFEAIFSELAEFRS